MEHLQQELAVVVELEKLAAEPVAVVAVVQAV
jgi:hypothetical protein